MRCVAIVDCIEFLDQFLAKEHETGKARSWRVAASKHPTDSLTDQSMFDCWHSCEHDRVYERRA